MNSSMVLKSMIALAAFFSNIKQEQLQITVLKQWQDLSKIAIYLK